MKRFLKWAGAILAGLALLYACLVTFLWFTRPPYLMGKETLTVAEARSLVEEDRGGAWRSLDLYHLTSLSPEVAAVLAEYEGDGGIAFHALRDARA